MSGYVFAAAISDLSMVNGGVMVGLSQVYACLVARLITGDDHLGIDY